MKPLFIIQPDGAKPYAKVIEELKEPATRINEYHSTIKRSFVTAFENVVEAGKLLSQCKGTIGHGQFGEWVESYTDISHRTADYYMEVAAYVDEISKHSKIAKFADLTITDHSGETVKLIDLSVNGFLKLFKKPKPKKKKSTTPTPRELDPFWRLCADYVDADAQTRKKFHRWLEGTYVRKVSEMRVKLEAPRKQQQ